MSHRALPEPPDLEHLTKQAEDLVEAHRAGEPDAVARVATLGQAATASSTQALTRVEAQHVIAREYGLASWSRLVRYVALTPAARRLHDLDLLFQDLPGVRDRTLGLEELLEREAEALRDAHRARAASAAALIRIARDLLPAEGNQRRAKQTDDEIFASELTPERAREVIARWHWFDSWASVRRDSRVLVDPVFEAAADAIVAGEADALAALVAGAPAIVHARSPFGHHATLLHHVAANGIEASRQWQSPPNAVEIARILLDAGADPDATCDVYGGGSTALTLLVTSVHPATAGVQADLVEVLCRAGARPDGFDDDGSPLWAALRSGYTAAAERLVRCGARLDNLVFAASLGDLAAVRGYFAGDGDGDGAGTGALVDDRARDWGKARLSGLDRDHMLEYALIYAALHGRRAVVEFLLSRHPDLAVREPIWNNTARDAAAWGHPELIALLEPPSERSRPT